MEGKLTFWKLISNYRIEIPVIQRDYAQGRASAGAIRNNFLNSIKEALVGNKGMDMNFVYGSIEEGDTFVPIDGQQRLTTLYLLHLYLIHALGKDPSDYPALNNFTYKTRITSSYFCDCFSTRTISYPKTISFSEIDDLKAAVTDNAWFGSSWKNDPTVDAMLNMLNSIHEEFGKRDDLEDLLQRLMSDDCPLFFYFLDLGKYELEDSIYIKMNARGKALTDYENFKAKLEKYLKDKNVQGWEKFAEKLDRQWTDVFWNFVDDSAFDSDGNVLFDDKILNFIINYIFNDYACNTVTEGRDPLRKEFAHLQSLTGVEFTNEFSGFNNGLKGHTVEQSVEEMFSVFDLMTDGKKLKQYAPSNDYYDETAMFRDIVTPQRAGNGFTPQTRAKFYAYSQFLLKNKTGLEDGTMGKEALIEWFRVVKHLIDGEYFGGEDKYARLIKGLHWLADGSADIISFLCGISTGGDSEDADEAHGINRYILSEECLKAALISKSSEWNEAVRKAEKNPYLSGEINIILEFAGITEEKEAVKDWDSVKSTEYLKAFQKYANYMDVLFVDGGSYIGLKTEVENVFRRALLTKGDFTQKEGQNSSMLVNKSNARGTVTWAQLFKPQRNPEFKMKRSYIKALFDDQNFDINNVPGSCGKIISAYKCTDLEYRFFIEIPELMDFTIGKSSEHKGTTCWNFFRNSDQTKFLLWTTRLSGYNYDYYKRALYLVLRRENSEKLQSMPIKYGIADVKNQPIVIKTADDDVYEITVDYADKLYVITGGKNPVNEKLDFDGVVDYIKKNNLL